MPVTMNIIADSAEQLVQEFRRLNELTTPSITDMDAAQLLAKLSLDDIVHVVRERLRDEGFKLEVIDQRDQNPPASPPQTAPEAGPQTETGSQIDPPAEDEILPAPKAKKGKKANGALPVVETITEPPVIEEPKAASDPEEDRQHVMDTLGGLATKSKLKSKVFDFAGRLAKQHGKDKLSELPADPFPTIRKAMEEEFADVIQVAT